MTHSNHYQPVLIPADVAKSPGILETDQEVALLWTLEPQQNDVTATRITCQLVIQPNPQKLLAEYSRPGCDLTHSSADPVLLDPYAYLPGETQPIGSAVCEARQPIGTVSRYFGEFDELSLCTQWNSHASFAF